MDQGMTMVFVVSDPSMLKAAKAGDKVKFDAERVNGHLIVTKIQKAK
jgi:Cu/Ag efflux protein CusF